MGKSSKCGDDPLPFLCSDTRPQVRGEASLDAEEKAEHELNVEQQENEQEDNEDNVSEVSVEYYFMQITFSQE